MLIINNHAIRIDILICGSSESVDRIGVHMHESLKRGRTLEIIIRRACPVQTGIVFLFQAFAIFPYFMSTYMLPTVAYHSFLKALLGNGAYGRVIACPVFTELKYRIFIIVPTG